ncbi:MAG: triacylglycerol lipase [Myxococcota bacterium]
MFRKSLILIFFIVALGGLNRPAEAAGYTETRYPIVLAHGASGFDELFGVIDYFFGIANSLSSGGADVYLTEVSQFNDTELRGAQLLAQVEEIVAITGAGKVNLIGHSHGGLDSRYGAAMRPDLVASVTSVGTPHRGAELADLLRSSFSNGSFGEGILSFFADSLGTILALLSGTSNPQDAVAALESLTTAGTTEFNAAYPQGLPTSNCGSGPAQVGGIYYFSWSGARSATNLLDVSDVPLVLTSFFYSEPNDGLVGKCSSNLGDVIRNDYKQNHLDEVNQVFGLVHLFSSNPKSIFRAHANRLRNMGL